MNFNFNPSSLKYVLKLFNEVALNKHIYYTFFIVLPYIT